MYLKSLFLHGFKSFADKTQFDFDPGVTGIVGPNGCGKSNVVDAVRWVLGETSAKALRGGEMADVIFNGSEKRRPLGMAEVTLTLADCEEALKTDRNEVSVTRRVYRDGKSEYLINGTKCRLRDIGNLFMDTGIGRSSYSIMEQGKIDMLLSAKPEDRRQVFEEAAGITKSKKEKKEALRKLEHTEANLLRVSDVLDEQERRMKGLKRQAVKAKRYQELATDVHILDTHLSHRVFTQLQEEKETLTKSISGLGSSREELEASLPKQEEALQEARAQLEILDGELQKARQTFGRTRNEVEQAQNRIEFNTERRKELSERIVVHQETIAEATASLDEQQSTLEQNKQALADLEERIATQQQQERDLGAALQEATTTRQAHAKDLDKTQTALAMTGNDLTSATARLENANNQLATQEERAAALEMEGDDLQDHLEVATTDTEDAEKQLAAHQADTEVLTKAAEELQAAVKTARQEVDEKRKTVTEHQRDLAKKSSRLDVLRDLLASGEGLEKGTQAVLKGLDDPQLFKPALDGVFAKEIKAPDEYAVAIESILGPYLQTVLVRDDEVSNEIINRLAEKKRGTAALLSRNLLPTASGDSLPAVPDSAKAWAVALVEVKPEFQGLIERLLADVLVVPTLDEAFALRKSEPALTFVTLKGEILTSEGILRGGVAGKDAGSVIKRKNEIDQLAGQVVAMEEEEAELRKAVADAEEAVKTAQAEADGATETLQQHRVTASRLQGELNLAQKELKTVEEAVARNQRDRKKLTEQGDQAKAKIEKLEKERDQAETKQQELGAALEDLQKALGEAQQKEELAREEFSHFKTALAVEQQQRDSAAKEQNPMLSRIQELRESSLRRERELASDKKRIEEGDAENEELKGQIEIKEKEMAVLKEQLEGLDNSRADQHAQIETLGEEARKNRQKLDRAQRDFGKQEVTIAKIDLKIENVVRATQERHQVDLEKFEATPDALHLCVEERKYAAKNGGRKPAEDRPQIDERKNEQLELTEQEQVAVEEEPAEAEGPEMQTEGPQENVAAEVPEEKQEDVAEDVKEEEKVPEITLADIDWEFVESTVADLKRKLDGMGPVNLDAIEEYDELIERFDFTRGQHDDLVNSKQKLMEIIDRINTESEKLFKQTFNTVAKNFREMFQRLFGEKGKADLVLQDEENPLECGIEVIAKPPGKKLQSITLMSGGERSMTAVALLFSIYMVKPSPFCVLDELDAPLDESNIGRFLKVLDAFIDQSQFIIVTHSKRTMERADVMYGVTMEEFGVSKPVGMRLAKEKEGASGGEQTAAQKAAARLDA